MEEYRLLQTLENLVMCHNNDYGFDVDDCIDSGDLEKLPSLSVVIPYYETGKIFYAATRHLNNAMSFVKKKDAKWNNEVIIIDDGSINKKAEKFIYEKLPKVKVVKSKNNNGITDTRNIGLDEAKMEKILFIDSDIVVSESSIFNHLKVHASNLFKDDGRKVVSVGFFKFTDEEDEIINRKIIRSADVGLDDFRVNCVYGPTWIGCEEDKKFVNKSFQIVNQTNNFRNWPSSGFFGPWFLPNMILGGLFLVDTQHAKRVNGFSPSFHGYGFAETSLPTKLIAAYDDYVIPIIDGACIHVGNQMINVSRKEKDKIFALKHDFYFNKYIKLTLKEALLERRSKK